jgi:hypothetical protein
MVGTRIFTLVKLEVWGLFFDAPGVLIHPVAIAAARQIVPAMFNDFMIKASLLNLIALFSRVALTVR